MENLIVDNTHLQYKMESGDNLFLHSRSIISNNF